MKKLLLALLATLWLNPIVFAAFIVAAPSLAFGQAAGGVALQPVGQTTKSASVPVTMANDQATGSVTSSSVAVTNSSTTVLAAATFTKFVKVCVPATASTGIWVRWDGVAATTAAPAEYMPPGQCDSWSQQGGYLPTQQFNGISNSAATITISVVGS